MQRQPCRPLRLRQHPAQGDAEGTGEPSQFLGQVQFGIVHRIAQGEDGGGVALHGQIARKEEGIAILDPVHHGQEGRQRPGDAGVMRGWLGTAVGGHRQGAGLQQQDPGQVSRVYQEASHGKVAKTVQHLRMGPGHAPGNSAEEQVQRRKRKRCRGKMKCARQERQGSRHRSVLGRVSSLRKKPPLPD